jgi:hypothetical protein
VVNPRHLAAALADPAITSGLVSAVVALLVGVFGGGTIVALLRVNADKGKVVIEAAQGAVIVQTSVIDDLQAELQRVKGELAALRVENADLLRRIAAVERNGGERP